MDKVEKTDSEWRAELTPEQYQVLRKHGTERPFTGEYVHNKQNGTYVCAGCGQELFKSDTKFESGTGWPSFWDVIEQGKVTLIEDDSFFMQRIEARCSRCDGHLGHVFDDGPRDQTGLRYCINSVSLKFEPDTK